MTTVGIRREDYGQYVSPVVAGLPVESLRAWTESASEPKASHFVIESSTGDPYIGIVELEQDPRFSGYYNAYVIGLPGCVSYGEDLSSAIRNLQNALELYLTELAC